MLSEQSKARLYNILHKLLFKYNLLCIINTLKLPLYKFIPQDYIRNQLDKSLYLQIVCMKAMHNNEEVIYCFNRRQNYLTVSLLWYWHKANFNKRHLLFQKFGVFLMLMCNPSTAFTENRKASFKSLFLACNFSKREHTHIHLICSLICSICKYFASEIQNRQTTTLIWYIKNWQWWRSIAVEIGDLFSSGFCFT